MDEDGDILAASNVALLHDGENAASSYIDSLFPEFRIGYSRVR